MKKKLISKIVCLSFIFLVSVIFGVVFLTNTISVGVAESADDFILSGNELKSEYALGEKVFMPTGKFSIGGKLYDAQTLVYYPDGKCVLGSNVELTACGKYVVEYKTSLNGKLFSEKYAFMVSKDNYSVSSFRSSAVYGADLLMDAFGEEYYTGINGINLSLVDGDTFTYDKIIDLSEDGDVVSFYAVPSRGFQKCDVEFVIIQLTDAYNPDNVVTLQLRTHSGGWGGITGDWAGWGAFVVSHCYAQAKAEGQVLKGIDGKNLRVNSSLYGTIIDGGMWGSTGDASKSQLEQSVSLGMDELFSVYYDNADKQVLVNDTLVIDLDDLSYQEKAFEGFTTGEVFLSIYATNYKATKCNLVITDIHSEDLTAKRESFSKTIIDVDTSAFENENSIIGVKGKQFPVFNASAKDLYNLGNEIKVGCRAFYNYGSSERYEVLIQSGSFNPDKTGEYTLLYSVSDTNGKEINKIIKVNVVDNVGTLDINYGDHASTEYLGQEVAAAEYYLLNAVGIANVEIRVSDPSGNQIKTENGKFIPKTQGLYTVSYKVKDYIAQKSKSYQINVVKPNKIVLGDEPNLPSYFIAGTKYKLPEAFAYDYNTDKSVSATVEVVGGNKSGGYYTFSEGVARITYSFSGTEEKFGPYEIAVINVKDTNGTYLVPENYFVSKTLGITKQTTEQGIEFAADGSENNVSVEFLNELSAQDFSLIMYIDKNRNDFSMLSIYLTDAINEEESIKISFKKGVNGKYGSTLFINDREFSFFSSYFSFTSGDEHKLELNYSQAELMLYTSDNLLKKSLKLLPQEKQFTGFSSGRVKLKIAMEGVSGASAVYLTTIDDQFFYDELEDYMPPLFSLEKNYQSSYEFGSEIMINPCNVCDVLDGYTECKITLKSPSGRVLLNKAENVEHLIQLSEYGFYRLEYSYSDASGNDTTYIIAFSVPNMTAPTISVNFDLSGIKRGNKVTIPSATATDDIEARVTAICVVTDPNGNLKAVAEDAFEYEFKYNGTYRIRYFAIDSDGNMSDKIYYITVE